MPLLSDNLRRRAGLTALLAFVPQLLLGGVGIRGLVQHEHDDHGRHWHITAWLADLVHGHAHGPRDNHDSGDPPQGQCACDADIGEFPVSSATSPAVPSREGGSDRPQDDPSSARLICHVTPPHRPISESYLDAPIEASAQALCAGATTVIAGESSILARRPAPSCLPECVDCAGTRRSLVRNHALLF